MRSLFFALVLANLGFAAWQAWFAPSLAGRVIAPAGEPIRLLNEIEPGARALRTQAAPPAQTDAGAPDDSAAAAPEQAATRAAMPDGDDRGATGSGDAHNALRLPGPSPRIPLPTLTRAGGEAAPAAVVDSTAEDGAAARTGGAAFAGTAAAGAAAARCVGIGPFLEQTDAAEAAGRLRESGRNPEEHTVEADLWVDYWVYIGAIPTRAEANEMLAGLHEGGVTEAYLIAGEEDGHIISLGVFRQVSRARRLAEQIRELGLEPQIGERTRRGIVYWLDVTLEPGVELDFETLQAPGRIVRLEQRPCGWEPQ